MSSTPDPDSPRHEPGKEPKDADTLRSRLESLRQAGSGQEPGPLAGGMGRHDRLVLRTFYDFENARRFQRRLSRLGLTSQHRRCGRRVEVSVDYEDREAAAEILATHLEEDPDRRPTGIRRDFDSLFLGIMIGSCLGFIFAFDNAADLRIWASVVVFITLGGLIGHLCDRFRKQMRERRRIHFGVAEFLIIAVIPALILLVLRYIPEAIRM